MNQQMPPTGPQPYYPGQAPIMYQHQMGMPMPQNNFYGQGMAPMPLPPQQQYHSIHQHQQMSMSYNVKFFSFVYFACQKLHFFVVNVLQSVPVPAMFDAGARFNKAGSTVNVPPPPPGYAPNAAQIASMNGQPVALEKQKGSFWTGGKGAGTTFW